MYALLLMEHRTVQSFKSLGLHRDPKGLKGKKACVNVRNTDNTCLQCSKEMMETSQELTCSIYNKTFKIIVKMMKKMIKMLFSLIQSTLRGFSKLNRLKFAREYEI